MHAEINSRKDSGSGLTFWVAMAILAAGVLAVVLWLPSPAGRSPALHRAGVGKSVASLDLRPLNFKGEPLRLEGLSGRVVVLNFWGTWCPPCQQELPHIVALASQYEGDQAVSVVPVSCGQGTDPAAALPGLKKETEDLLARRGFSLRCYADPEQRSRESVFKLTGQAAYPTTVVLDGEGVVRGVWVGFDPGDEREVAGLVAELAKRA
jgi:cytochrome c biogenesis protein CcmG, thiol:disulfide interchange protein DsbE